MKGPVLLGDILRMIVELMIQKKGVVQSVLQGYPIDFFAQPATELSQYVEESTHPCKVRCPNWLDLSPKEEKR